MTIYKEPQIITEYSNSRIQDETLTSMPAMMKGLPELNQQDDEEEWNNFKSSEDYQKDRNKLGIKLNLLAQILQESKTMEEFQANINKRIPQLEGVIKRNKTIAANALHPHQENIGAVKTAFSNYSPSGAPVSGLEIVDMDLNNKDHYSEVAQRYRDFSLDFDSEDKTPMFITPLKVLSVKDAHTYASLGMELNSIIISDFPKKKSVRETLKHVKERAKYGGIQPEWGYMIMPCNRIVIRDAYDDVEGSKPVYTFASPAKLGMHLRNPNGEDKAGQKNGVIMGAWGVNYLSNRKATSLLGKAGLVPATLTDGKPAFFGNKTLYQGDRLDLLEYSKTLVRCLILRCMMRYATGLAFSKIDKVVKKSVKKNIANFLNACQSLGLIEKFDPQKTDFVEGKDGIYQLNVLVKYFKSAEYLDVVLLDMDHDVTENEN